MKDESEMRKFHSLLTHLNRCMFFTSRRDRISIMSSGGRETGGSEAVAMKLKLDNPNTKRIRKRWKNEDMEALMSAILKIWSSNLK